MARLRVGQNLEQTGLERFNLDDVPDFTSQVPEPRISPTLMPSPQGPSFVDLPQSPPAAVPEAPSQPFPVPSSFKEAIINTSVPKPFNPSVGMVPDFSGNPIQWGFGAVPPRSTGLDMLRFKAGKGAYAGEFGTPKDTADGADLATGYRATKVGYKPKESSPSSTKHSRNR